MKSIRTWSELVLALRAISVGQDALRFTCRLVGRMRKASTVIASAAETLDVAPSIADLSRCIPICVAFSYDSSDFGNILAHLEYG